MMSMVLPYKTVHNKSWTEEQPNFTQRSAESWGADFGSKVLNFRINGKTENVRQMIKYVVGYSYVSGTPGTFRLRRQPPARHPALPNLRCTKILSIAGEGLRNKAGEGAISVGDGTYGEYAWALVSALFEIPKYDMLSDNENSFGGDGVSPRPEYRRNTLFTFLQSCETLARKGNAVKDFMLLFLRQSAATAPFLAHRVRGRWDRPMVSCPDFHFAPSRPSVPRLNIIRHRHDRPIQLGVQPLAVVETAHDVRQDSECSRK